MNVKRIIQLEGLAVFLLAVGLYFYIGGAWWFLLVLALAPDISMVAYMYNQKVGSIVYNLFHTYVVPVMLIAIGVWLEQQLLLEIGLIWGAHIGMDRFCGFGLKYDTQFKDTHIDRM
ncbi:DUF4260 domain-containing protein [Bacillus sp. FSL W7-1360]